MCLMSPTWCGVPGFSRSDKDVMGADMSTAIAENVCVKWDKTWPPPDPKSSRVCLPGPRLPVIASLIYQASMAYSCGGLIIGHK